MKTDSRHAERPGEEWLRRVADAEARCDAVTVGGLAHDLGMLPASRAGGGLRTRSQAGIIFL